MTTYIGSIELKLPKMCVVECSAQGSVDDACEFWARKLKLKISAKKIIDELAEYGAWTREELQAMTKAELDQKLIWIGAGNIAEGI